MKTVIEITQGDNVFRMTVDSVVFVKLCPYNGDHEFTTMDYRGRFCCHAHNAHFYRKMSAVADELPKRNSIPSRPMR